MSVRTALMASVCTAWLAATAAAAGAETAQNPMVQQTASAYRALASGDTSKAIAEYSEAIESRELPADILANALLNRALAYQRAGQYQDAIDDYAAALRIDALNAKLRATALYNRGLAYQKIDRPALAIEDFTSALFLDSEFSYCYYSRGIALRDSGQYLFALSDFEKARRYNHPQPYLVYYGEALVYEALKRPEEAAKALQKALVLKPDFAPARQRLSALGESAPGTASIPSAADDLATGSISAASAGQIYAKQDLPAAVKPPEELLSETAPAQNAAAGTGKPSTKKYTDRIPQEAEPAKVTLASARSESEVPEKIVAIEAVPETPPSPVSETAPAEKPDVTTTASVEADAGASATEVSASTEPPGWSIQLSSAKQEKLAWGIWEKMKAKHKILADQKPIVVRADLGAKGIFYRLRLAGYPDSRSASALCAKLKAKRLSCFVSRTGS